MLLETEKERICINKIVGQREKQFDVEGDVIVNDVKPDVLSVISVDGVPCIYKKEIMEGKLRIDGCINTYIMYLADDENSTVRGLNTVLDFTELIDIDGCNENMTSKQKISIKNIECKILNGRKINVKANICVNAEIFSNEDVEVVSNINDMDDIQVLNDIKRVDSLIGYGSTKTIAKDTISVDVADEIAEIMKVNLRIINRDIKLSYNKVLAKADVDISLIYLTEDNRIESINTTIPVMGFIDIEKISDDSVCDVDYQIKNLIVKPNSSDMHSIYIEAEMEIICSAYEPKEISLIDDLYSISSDLNYKKKEINAMSSKQNLKEKCDIREQINIPELTGSKLYNAKITPNIISTTLKNGKIIYEGELEIELLFGMNENINSKTMNISFDFEVLSDNVDKDCFVDTIVDVSRDEFIVNNDTIDANIQLEFNIDSNKNEKINVMNEITVEENRENNIYSMVIYFVRPGDTLWKIAKKFKSTVEDIVTVNNIEDENSISIGQQLYIPKFLKKDIAV